MPLQTMEEDPDLSYEVPVSAPHILVNQLGYITESTKVAVFCGSQMPDRFEVIDAADTGKTVYTGKPESRESRICVSTGQALSDLCGAILDRSSGKLCHVPCEVQLFLSGL